MRPLLHSPMFAQPSSHCSAWVLLIAPSDNSPTGPWLKKGRESTQDRRSRGSGIAASRTCGNCALHKTASQTLPS